MAAYYELRHTIGFGDPFLADMTRNRIRFVFDYVRIVDRRESLVARGKQRIACTRGPNENTVPSQIPAAPRDDLYPAETAGRRAAVAVRGSR